MYIGKVIGTVVATRKESSLDGLKLLIVQKMDIYGKLSDNFIVAADAVGAGFHETVLIVQGSSARITEASGKKPVDAAIIGIIDSIDIDD